jgi:hypothetical protein
MRFTSLGALALATSASAQNVVQFDIRRGLPGQFRVGTPATGFLSRRDAHAATIANNITGGGYYVDVEVGTPGQPITMVLDTGSSDAWIVSYQADLCTSRSLQNKYGDSCGPTFNPSKSSTYATKISDGFSITYVDQTGAQGDYITDNFKIAGVTVESLQMGLATTVVRGVGVLGVGFTENVAAVRQYPNLIEQLASQGFTKSRAFSLYLNDRRSESGTILFGGVDTDKFIGKLHTLPILEQPSGYTHYGVVMSGLELAYSNGSTAAAPISGGMVGAILDSGTTLTYLPDSTASPLFRALNVYTDHETTGLSLVDCDLLDSEADMTLTFGFGGGANAQYGEKFDIAVPVHELVLDLLQGYEHLLPTDIPFDNVCVFGIQSSGGLPDGGGEATDEITLLGDTMLRSAYVVYDVDHHQIGMAQANVNSTETKIEELTSEGEGLPSLTGVASQQTSARPTATRGTTATSLGSGGTSSTASGDASQTSGGQSTVTVTASPTPNVGASSRGGGGEVFWVVVLAGVFAGVGGGLFML